MTTLYMRQVCYVYMVFMGRNSRRYNAYSPCQRADGGMCCDAGRPAVGTIS